MSYSSWGTGAGAAPSFAVQIRRDRRVPHQAHRLHLRSIIYVSRGSVGFFAVSDVRRQLFSLGPIWHNIDGPKGPA